MGNKVNLAIQNQYVEFAKKDGEGNDIAEGIKALHQAVGGVVAFDGEVLIEQTGSAPVIHKVSQGIYKVKKGTNWILDGVVLVGSAGHFIGYCAPRFIGFTQNVVITGQFGENETAEFNVSSIATRSDLPVGFDGELTLGHGASGGFKITPTSYGVYKAILDRKPFGIVVVGEGGPSGYYQASALFYSGDVYEVTNPTALGSESTLTIVNYIKLYKHALSFSFPSKTYNIFLITTSPESISGGLAASRTSQVPKVLLAARGEALSIYSEDYPVRITKSNVSSGPYSHAIEFDIEDDPITIAGSNISVTDTVTPL